MVKLKMVWNVWLFRWEVFLVMYCCLVYCVMGFFGLENVENVIVGLCEICGWNEMGCWEKCG